jgi:hypothetical protein
MTTVAAMALALSVLAQTPGVGAPAKESAELTVPLYLSCDGITSDQRILKILRVTSNSISIWNSDQSRWGLLCGEHAGSCAINEKTISFATENSVMSILRRTGQFESQLSNGATWMGACTETTDPALGAKPSPH